MESLEQVQSRHRKEAKDLQCRITNKKKNTTKKNRKGVNDECAELERQLKLRHEEELRKLNGDNNDVAAEEEDTTTEQQSRNDVKSEDKAINSAASKLEKTSLTDPAPSPTDTTDTTTSTQQQPPKKRNRQKERLARRQAEQEAEAEAAQAEAANMTDHRKIEKTYMLNAFKANALEEKEIQPDGHCLFSAIADQLAQNAVPLGTMPGEKPYKVVRRAAAGYIADHADDFLPFLEEPLDEYVKKIRDTAEWGGQLELVALANTYRVEIHVIQDGSIEVVTPTTVEGAEEMKMIWLAYYRHGYGLGEHYNSLRKKT